MGALPSIVESINDAIPVVSGKILTHKSVMKLDRSPFLINAWTLLAFSLSPLGEREG
jgi:hypothetical protein